MHDVAAIIEQFVCYNFAIFQFNNVVNNIACILDLAFCNGECVLVRE